MSRYALLKSPLWIAGIVIALVTIVAFVNLGFWQLRRLEERRTINATIEARSAADPIELEEAITTYGADPEALAYRRVLVEGDYAQLEEVLVVATPLNGRPGHDVLTPLRTDSVNIAVDRGWVPIDTEGPPVVEAAPTPGSVEVVGMLLEGQIHRSLGTPGADGSYEEIGRIDLGVLAGQWEVTCCRCTCLSRAKTRPQEIFRCDDHPPSQAKAATSCMPFSGSRSPRSLPLAFRPSLSAVRQLRPDRRTNESGCVVLHAAAICGRTAHSAGLSL